MDDQIMIKHFKMGSLGKACEDPYLYRLKLITGEIIEFEIGAHLEGGEYIHLTGITKTNMGTANEGRRGITVRTDSIVWCMDLGK